PRGVSPTARPSTWTSPHGVAPTNRRPGARTVGGRAGAGAARGGRRGAGRSTGGGRVSRGGTESTGAVTAFATWGSGTSSGDAARPASREPDSPAPASPI